MTLKPWWHYHLGWELGGSACELPRPQLYVADDDNDDDDDDDDDDDHDGGDDDGGDDDDHDDTDYYDDLSRSGQTIAFDRSFTKSKYNIKFSRSHTHVQKDLYTWR